MADNASLGAAKTAKNDEFYTQYSDIEAEMNALETAPFAYRFPKIAALPILFVGGGIQGSSHTCQSLVNTLRRGWDVVVIDSLEKVCSTTRLG